MKIDVTIQMKKHAVDVLVSKAMADAGMLFEDRMRFGPAISQSLVDQAANTDVASNLYNFRLNRIDFNL